MKKTKRFSEKLSVGNTKLRKFLSGEKRKKKMENERNKIKLGQQVRKSKIQNSSSQNRKNGGEIVNKTIYKNYPRYKGMNFSVERCIIFPAKWYTIIISQDSRDSKSTLKVYRVLKRNSEIRMTSISQQQCGSQKTMAKGLQNCDRK